jgi:hypothetical protein
MRGLTDGVMNTGQASPIAVFGQQAVQVGKSLHRCAWRTQGQGGADGGVQHPACYRNDDAVADLYVDKFTRGAALAIHAAQSSAVQRMPTVEDLDFLPDMGRMNWNWCWEDRTGCSQAACARANGREPVRNFVCEA